MKRLRGHAYFLECVGRSGGPSPWWLVVLCGLALAAAFGGHR